TGDRAWSFRGPSLESFPPSRHLMFCCLCFLGGRKGRFSPLTSALRHYRRNACPSRRLPTPGRCRSVPNATSRIQLQLCDVRSRCASPPYSIDAHAAPSLGQIAKIDDMFDAVGLGHRRRRWDVTQVPMITLNRPPSDGGGAS